MTSETKPLLEQDKKTWEPGYRLAGFRRTKRDGWYEILIEKEGKQETAFAPAADVQEMKNAGSNLILECSGIWKEVYIGCT